MIGHLGGARVSALLDGQLGAEETERAWAHVHQCHACRDQVEREGWVKTRLAGLSFGADAAPAGLKGSLLGAASGLPPGDLGARADVGPRSRARTGLVAIGGGAIGAAVVGVLALGTAPADAPGLDRRAPVPPSSVTRVTPTPTPTTPSPTPTSRHSALTPSQR
ncbi:hypothetical protein [Nocardioides pantholopis]|uniref:hypothetical protein n=1 Tax=Nocardioides pantholopis TaxID=2483798 RepID=UPI000F08C311|nr:hypothetical protein [Nocardioides pantholopis]